FPHWIKGYLGQCVMRMDSPKARKSGDLRKVLPWVLGFPANRKRGPRKNNLMADTRMAIFPTLFTDYVIRHGLGPREAPTEACNRIFKDNDKRAQVDVETLRRWIKKHFGLKIFPRTAAEWQEVENKYWRDFSGV